MTQTLYEMALDLAEQSADTIGAAREAAVRFLAPCDQAQYLYREDYPEETEEKLTGQLQSPERTMLIAPNPSTGLFEVFLPQRTGGSLMVYNTHGQRLREQSIAAEASKVSIDLGAFPNGLYWVVLVNEAGNILGTAKVSVAH